MDTQTIISSYEWIQANILNNQFLIAVLGGSVSYALLKVFNFLKLVFQRNFIASIDINSENSIATKAVENYFNSRKFLNKFLHKNLSFTGIVKSSQSSIITPGYDRHYFFYKRKLFWMTKAKDADIKTRLAYTYNISTFGITNNPLINFIKDISQDSIDSMNKSIMVINAGSSYSSYSKVEYRYFDSIFMDEKDKKYLLDRIDFFKNNQEWYFKRGIPYKLVILLHGLPGTGKSSLIKAISTKYNSPIVYVSDETSKSSLNEAIYNISADYAGEFSEEKEGSINPIIVLEEADTAISENRETEFKDFTGNTKQKITLKDYLNILDGLQTTTGAIYILTTNYKDKLDKAILRPGRIDVDIEMKPLGKEIIEKMVKTFYPNLTISLKSDIRIIPAKLQQILMEYDSSEEIEREIQRNQYDNI